MPERQKIECPKGAQLYVAVSILSASIGIPASPSSSMNILQNSASSRQSIPGLRPAPSLRGDAFYVNLKTCGASIIFCAAPPTWTLNLEPDNQKNTCFRRCFPSLQLLFQKLNERFRDTAEGLISAPRKKCIDILRLFSDRSETDPTLIKKGEYPLPADKIAHALIDHDGQVRGEVRLDHGRMAILIRMPGKEHRIKICTKPPQQGNAVKLRWIQRASCLFNLSTWEI